VRNHLKKEKDISFWDEPCCGLKDGSLLLQASKGGIIFRAASFMNSSCPGPFIYSPPNNWTYYISRLYGQWVLNIEKSDSSGRAVSNEYCYSNKILHLIKEAQNHFLLEAVE